MVTRLPRTTTANKGHRQVTAPENAADPTGDDMHILEPITKALQQLKKDADRAQLHAARNLYAMGQRDALDKALNNVAQALNAVNKALREKYCQKNNDHNDT